MKSTQHKEKDNIVPEEEKQNASTLAHMVAAVGYPTPTGWSSLLTSEFQELLEHISRPNWGLVMPKASNITSENCLARCNG